MARLTSRVKAGNGTAAAAMKRKAFLNAYMANGHNASKAAITAGYSPNAAAAQGARLLRYAKNSGELAALAQEAGRAGELSVERTLKEIARLAYSDPRALYDDRGNLKPVHELDDDTAATIASVEVEQAFAGRGKKRRLSGYTRKVKQWDKNAALEKAMKHLGLFEKDNAQQGREGLVLKIETAKPVKR